MSLRKGLANTLHCLNSDLLLERICDQGQNFLVFVEEEHDAKISQAFVCKTRAGDKLQAFDLAKVRWVTEHVDVEQLCNIVVARIRVLLFERGSNRR